MSWREFVPPQINHNSKDKRVKRDKRSVPEVPEHLMAQLRRVNAELDEVYPVGAIQWVSEHRPDLMRYARGAETAIDTAILAEDGKSFRQSLERYRTVYLDIFSVFPGCQVDEKTGRHYAAK